MSQSRGLAAACTIAVAIASAIPGSSRGSTASTAEVDAIRWSHSCSLGGPGLVVILLRIDRAGGGVDYESGLRGTSGAPLIGAYGSGDANLFQAAIRLIDEEKAEEIKLRPDLHLDGCEPQLSITRSDATTLTISGGGMNDADPAYRRFVSLLDRLSAEALKVRWVKISAASSRVYPIDFRDLYQPSGDMASRAVRVP